MFHPSSPKCLRSPSTALTLPSLPPLAISPFPPPHLPSHLLITALSSPMLVQIRVDVSLAAEGIPPRVWAPTSPPRNVALPARPKTECALRRSSVALHERAANECCQRACPRSEVPPPQQAHRSPTMWPAQMRSAPHPRELEMFPVGVSHGTPPRRIYARVARAPLVRCGKDHAHALLHTRSVRSVTCGVWQPSLQSWSFWNSQPHNSIYMSWVPSRQGRYG